MQIVLASTSSRRIEDPKMLTQKLAKAKAESVAGNYPNSIVIGSDLVVSFEGKILEKADNEVDQRELIILQRGKIGEIFTSVYVVNTATKKEIIKTVVTPYVMANVSDEKIDEYVKSGQGVDKAGGFGFQDYDGMFLKSMNGCYSNVLGIPMCELSNILRDMGVKINVDIKEIVKEKTGREC